MDLDADVAAYEHGLAAGPAEAGKDQVLELERLVDEPGNQVVGRVELQESEHEFLFLFEIDWSGHSKALLNRSVWTHLFGAEWQRRGNSVRVPGAALGRKRLG